jgi:hypothetical protein
MQSASASYMDWGTGICGCCCQDCGLWALALVCPCVVYVQNLTLMRQLGLVSYVPFCDNKAAVPGCLHGTAFYATYFSSYLSILRWAPCASCPSLCSASLEATYVTRIRSGLLDLTGPAAASPRFWAGPTGRYAEDEHRPGGVSRR